MLPPGQSVSQSGPGTSLVQSGPLSLPQLTLTPEMATWTSSTLSSVQSSKLCLVLLIDSTLDTGHSTLDTGQDRTNYPVPAIHCSFNKTLLLQLQLEHIRSRLQNRSNYSSITGETVANQLNDKRRHKNSKSA